MNLQPTPDEFLFISGKNGRVMPMPGSGSPAIKQLWKKFAPRFIWGELIVSAHGERYEIRHQADQASDSTPLQPFSRTQLRELAQRTATGEFRPLRSAPDLQRGWKVEVTTLAELEEALNLIYPGSVADWFAAESGVRATNYREFTNRQSGMYRITQMLTDAQAQRVARACCHPRFCLKQRLWTVGQEVAEREEGAPTIACLEPCAILLEMARKAMRIEQESKITVELPVSDWETITEALEQILKEKSQNGKAAELSAPLSPRRVELVLEKCREQMQANKKNANEV
jgi:hypothetical protein